MFVQENGRLEECQRDDITNVKEQISRKDFVRIGGGWNWLRIVFIYELQYSL